MRNRIISSAGCGILGLAFGLVLTFATAPAALAQSCYQNSNPNLVQNGGFESGSVGSNIPKWKVRWTGTLSTGNPVDPFVTVGNGNPHSGAQELDIGTTSGANDITQPIKGTTAGDVYTVCFWLASAPDQLIGKTSFDVLWNDVSELELTQSGPSTYQYYTFTVVSTTNDHLRFRERNDDGFYYLDDVAIQLCSGCTTGPQFKKK